MQPTVVTILSTNYAGSHFLSFLLGSHPRSVHLDEVRHFQRSRTGRRSDCRICGTIERCPIVRNVQAAGVDSVYRQIHANLREDGQDPLVMIDTSKKVAWARRFVGDTTFRHKYVHLIRDPRALVRRWLLTHRTFKASLHLRRKAALRGDRLRPRLLLAPQWEVCAYKWLQANQQIAEFIAQHQLDCQVVTYSDLATNSIAELRRLMNWIGLPFAERQLRYWQAEHHVGAAEGNYAWIEKQNKTGHVDVRWRDTLEPAIREAITRNSDISGCLERHSLRFTDNGLSRSPRRDQPTAQDECCFSLESQLLPVAS